MPDDNFTPVDRPLMRSDLNDILRVVHKIESVQVRWYGENKVLIGRVTKLEERRLWLPALVSIVAAAFAVLARITP